MNAGRCEKQPLGPVISLRMPLAMAPTHSRESCQTPVFHVTRRFFANPAVVPWLVVSLSKRGSGTSAIGQSARRARAEIRFDLWTELAIGSKAISTWTIVSRVRARARDGGEGVVLIGD